jgi:hypothetical protein
VYERYVAYCVKGISDYFCAVKDIYKSEWNIQKGSRLLTVTSIVGFLRAYKKSLEKYDGPQDFDFYKGKLRNLDVDFKDYTSSHWNDLAEQIAIQCWI